MERKEKAKEKSEKKRAGRKQNEKPKLYSKSEARRQPLRLRTFGHGLLSWLAPDVPSVSFRGCFPYHSN